VPRKEFVKYLDEDKLERIRVRLQIKKGKIEKLVIQYESFITNEWRAIVRYDTAHGFFHRDVLYPNGEQVKQSINIENLNNAVLYAEQDLKDRWEFYKNRYIKKLSNDK